MRKPLSLSFLLLLPLLTFWACTTQPRAQITWPGTDPTVQVKESQYLDLGLRVLSLELNQRENRVGRVYLQFLPSLGKIEARFILEEARLSRPKKISKEDEKKFLEEAFNREVEAVTAGAKSVLETLQISQGFDAAKNLKVHFDLEAAGPNGAQSNGQSSAQSNAPTNDREIAVYDDGQLSWLTLF